MLKTISLLIATLIPLTMYAAKLEVTIENIDSDEGNIRFALFDDAKFFPSDDANAVMLTDSDGRKVPGIIIPAKKDKVSFTVFVPAGVYAATAYQDVNNNEKLDTILLIGLPTEPYGFANNARDPFGPPTFEEATFTIPETGAKLTFDVQ